jgi:SAM-dependent methyltransferase
MSAAANADQMLDWNGEQGRGWAEQQPVLDRMIEPFGDAALQAAAARPGEKVLDVGCGCGTTTLALAQTVGNQGRVLGVDISRPMLEVARRAAAGRGARNVDFVEADASAATLPVGQDLLHSRFGLMFFDAPAAALRHLRGALKPGGRCAFVCWRAPRDNPWAMTPLMAVRRALGVTPPPADPLMPGPFAFADGERLRSLLAEAGYVDIVLQRLDAPVRIGPSARAAALHSLRLGPASRLARTATPQQQPMVAAAIESELAPLAGADGSIALTGSTWVVTSRNPG